MHPHMAQQLAVQKNDELRRQADFARLASANRRTRRNGLRWPRRLLGARNKGVGAPPPIPLFATNRSPRSFDHETGRSAPSGYPSLARKAGHRGQPANDSDFSCAAVAPRTRGATFRDNAEVGGSIPPSSTKGLVEGHFWLEQKKRPTLARC